jgi:hypothetical protein
VPAHRHDVEGTLPSGADQHDGTRLEKATYPVQPIGPLPIHALHANPFSEIGEIPSDTQIALLRVLQERQIERVGGSRAIPADVRVIAATNRDLSEAIANGTFRSDLFYRLNVFPIQVLPLRKRRDDIPIMVEYFVKRFAEKMAKRIHRIDKRTWSSATDIRGRAFGHPLCRRHLQSMKRGCPVRRRFARRGRAHSKRRCRIRKKR